MFAFFNKFTFAFKAFQRLLSRFQEGDLQHERIVGKLYSRKVLSLQTLGDVIHSKCQREGRKLLIQQLKGQNLKSLQTVADVLNWSATKHRLPSHKDLADELAKVLREEEAKNVSTYESSGPQDAPQGLEDCEFSMSRMSASNTLQTAHVVTTKLNPDLMVAREAFRDVYSDFEENLYIDSSVSILGMIFSSKIIDWELFQSIRKCTHITDGKRILLYHFSQQNVSTLKDLVRILFESAEKDKLPSHKILAEKLDSSINEHEKMASLKSQFLLESSSERSCESDSASHKFDLIPCSTNTVTSSSKSADRDESYEMPELVHSLKSIFFGDLDKSNAYSKDKEELAIGKCHPSITLPVPGIKAIGFLKSKTHADLVLFLWRLGGTDKSRVDLAYQLIRMREDTPIELKIINVLGAVYASPDTAHLFREALKWTEREDCQNPVVLQCRLNYLLFLCYLESDEELSKHYLATAHQLSAQIPPEFTTAMIHMMMARTMNAECEKKGTLDDAKVLKITKFSHKAQDICSSMAEWMEPFTNVITVLKMQLDARLAHLMYKNGNVSGALCSASSIQSYVRDFERSPKFSELIPRQKATYHYTKVILSMFNDNLPEARRHAEIARELYLRVNSESAANKVMEVLES